ncbi:hypothetical protein SDC9_184125 [bioreactor metagenome]|uniref:Uncharacterized protein n=1 Tax=bioreactor metagenome TaxID=1076179 RepID=A0A645HC58_9ZZZZ
MAVDHRILQLGALPLHLRRHLAPGNLRQRLGEGIAIVEPHQAGEAEIGNAGAFLENVGGLGQRRTDHQGRRRLAQRLDLDARGGMAERPRDISGDVARGGGTGKRDARDPALPVEQRFVHRLYCRLVPEQPVQEKQRFHISDRRKPCFHALHLCFSIPYFTRHGNSKNVRGIR